MIPLYAFLQGDTIGLLILVYPHEKIKEVAKKLIVSARTRVTPSDPLEVYCGNKKLILDKTVAESGLLALDKIEVVKV